MTDLKSLPITDWPEIDVSTKEGLKLALLNKGWRLSHLYYIPNKQGVKTLFKPNFVQKEFFKNLHYSNVVLKSRQHGISTCIALYLLDECLFRPGFACALISESEDAAVRLFRTKVRFAYDLLPDDLKIALPLDRDTAQTFIFKNGSSLECGTTFRGGTLNACHVSELGKISLKFPEKAQEIITGALECVAPGQMRFVESTAAGSYGYFPDICKRAQTQSLKDEKLTPLDYKFHFFPWFMDPACTLDTNGNYDVLPDHEAYFARVERRGKVKLTPGQKMFYIKKKEALGEDVFKEYPSEWTEAFQASLQGTFFFSQFQMLRKNKQICAVPIVDGVCVDCYWDLGMDDLTAIWFCQNIGREIHIIDYFESCNEGLSYYARELEKKKYRYGRMVAPHDMSVRELTTGKSRQELARGYGLYFEIAPLTPVADQIEAARNIFSMCWFDEKRCATGLDHLESFRKKWNDRTGTWMSQPYHGPESHGSSAFLTMAISHKFGASNGGQYTTKRREVQVNKEYVW